MFIEFSFRKSLLYLSLYKVIYYIRSIEITLTNKFLLFNSPILQTFLMAIGEIVGGILVYFFIDNGFKKHKKTKYFGIKLVKSKNQVRHDGWIKIIILIFVATFFDFEEFYILNYVLSKIRNISPSISNRFSMIKTIVASLLCTYCLGFKIGRHNKIILIAISIAFVLNFFFEIVYNLESDRFFDAFFMNILYSTFITFTDVIERYLGNADFSNPFGVLAAEGFIMLGITSIYAIGKDPFGQMKNLYEKYDAGNFSLLIFLLFLYIILSACLNVYKFHCNIFLSPVARTLTDYVFNPIYLIYSYFIENDFKYKGEQNISFFLLNELMSIIFIFLGFVYNEYIILFFCGLEHDTRYGIYKRAELLDASNDERNSLDDEDDFDDDIEDVDDNNDNNKK